MRQGCLIAAAFGEGSGSSALETGFIVDQSLAALHCAAARTLCFFYWRGHSVSLFAELQVYILSGWSFWLLGAAYRLSVIQRYPTPLQITVALVGLACISADMSFSHVFAIVLRSQGYREQLAPSSSFALHTCCSAGSCSWRKALDRQWVALKREGFASFY